MKRTTALKLLAMALLALACHAPWTHSSSSQPAPLSTAQGGAAAPSADPFADARFAIDAARQIGLPPGNYRVDVERIWVSESDVSAIGAMFMYSGTDFQVTVRPAGQDPLLTRRPPRHRAGRDHPERQRRLGPIRNRNSPAIC